MPGFLDDTRKADNSCGACYNIVMASLSAHQILEFVEACIICIMKQCSSTLPKPKFAFLFSLLALKEKHDVL